MKQLYGTVFDIDADQANSDIQKAIETVKELNDSVVFFDELIDKWFKKYNIRRFKPLEQSVSQVYRMHSMNVYRMQSDHSKIFNIVQRLFYSTPVSNVRDINLFAMDILNDIRQETRKLNRKLKHIRIECEIFNDEPIQFIITAYIKKSHTDADQNIKLIKFNEFCLDIDRSEVEFNIEKFGFDIK